MVLMPLAYWMTFFSSMNFCIFERVVRCDIFWFKQPKDLNPHYLLFSSRGQITVRPLKMSVTRHFSLLLLATVYFTSTFPFLLLPLA